MSGWLNLHNCSEAQDHHLVYFNNEAINNDGAHYTGFGGSYNGTATTFKPQGIRLGWNNSLNYTVAGVVTLIGFNRV